MIIRNISLFYNEQNSENFTTAYTAQEVPTHVIFLFLFILIGDDVTKILNKFDINKSATTKHIFSNLEDLQRREASHRP